MYCDDVQCYIQDFLLGREGGGERPKGKGGVMHAMESGAYII